LEELARSRRGLAEDVPGPGGENALADRGALADGRREQALGFGWPASQPLGHARVPPDDGAEHRLALAPGGHGPRDEIDRGLGVAAKLGEIHATERYRGRDVDQTARRAPRGR